MDNFQKQFDQIDRVIAGPMRPYGYLLLGHSPEEAIIREAVHFISADTMIPLAGKVSCT